MFLGAIVFSEWLRLNWFGFLSVVANIVSIIGFGLTIWVLREVGDIRRHYQAIGRIPDLAQKLEQRRTEISNHLNDFANFGSQIPKQLDYVETYLESLLRILHDKEDAHIKMRAEFLLGKVRQYRASPGFDAATDINDGLHGVIIRLEEKGVDTPWQR
jgi:hypothetical protein